MKPNELDSRVAAIEADVSNIRVGFDRFQTDVRGEFAALRRDLMSNGRTNWGWIIAASGVAIALVGSIGASFVRPLQAFDEAASVRLKAVEGRVDEATDRATRAEERLRVYAEFGRFPNEKPPTP